MPFVTSREMLLDAQKNRYAVGAFNFENMEMAQAIVQAAEKAKAAVMLQTTLSTLKYGGFKTMAAIARSLAEDATVPVALHLDHGDDFSQIMRAIKAGYSSLMIDASKKGLDENIALTRRVVEVASPMGLPVEAELGKVGGKEDDIQAGGDGPGYTDPNDARRFVAETGVGSLAVGIGTAHGFYKGEPKLAFDVLESIRGVVDIPLVLHGASGLSRGDVRRCIGLGICKVNFATELRFAFTSAAREFLAANPDAFDPKKFGALARQKVTELVLDRIDVCSGAA